MTKDIIRKSLELVKTDKMSDNREDLYDVGVFLNFLFGTLIRAKYRPVWNSSVPYTYVIVCDNSYTFPAEYFTTFGGYLKGCWIDNFVEDLDKILDDEDREDIETLLPLAKRYYQVWWDNSMAINGIAVSEPDIIPYLMRREDKIIYTVKTCLML